MPPATCPPGSAIHDAGDRRPVRYGRLTASILFALLCVPVMAGCGGMMRNENAEGVKLYQQGNYLGAVSHFQQALAQQPGSPDCFYNLGATYHQQSKLLGRPADMQTAEQYYHLCLARNPNHQACQRAMAVLLVEENRSAEAVALLQDWSRRDPANPDPQIELARLCQEHGDMREAENHLIDALAIDPANPRALVALGHLREATGDSGQALANYSRALAVDGQQPVVAARVASLSTNSAVQTTAMAPVQQGGAVGAAQPWTAAGTGNTAALPMPATPGNIAR